MVAATRPERVASLVLSGTFAVLPTSAPEAYSPELVQRVEGTLAELWAMVEHWGDGSTLNVFAPAAGELQRRAWATFERAAASPSMARALMTVWTRLDVRDILGSVHVPTLVLHIEGDRIVPVEAGRLLAEGIPGARFVAYPGTDHDFWFGECTPIVDEIERFVTGTVHPVEPDRILATVLFTDIVGSTSHAAALGDGAWRAVLERHDTLVGQIVGERGGRVVKHIGDGALSAFDGPARAIQAAERLRDAVAELGIELRAGVHTGECEAIGEDLGGLAVHIGARVSALAGPGEIVVSSTVKELVVGSGMQFTDRGEHELKGVPGTWRVYALGEDSAPMERIDGAAAHMRRSDRVTIALARRAPQVMRFGARLSRRGEP